MVKEEQESDKKNMDPETVARQVGAPAVSRNPTAPTEPYNRAHTGEVALPEECHDAELVEKGIGGYLLA